MHRLVAKPGSDAPETQKPGFFENPGFSPTARRTGRGGGRRLWLACGAVQETLVEEDGFAVTLAPVTALPWPEAMPAQAAAVRGVLARSSRPLTPAEVAAAFGGPAGKRPVVRGARKK
jgi:hypothetical protein